MNRNTVIKAAVALAFGAVAASSFAGTVGSLPRNFAYPLFSGATPAAISIAPVSFSTARPLASNTTYYVFVKLSNGAKFVAAPAAATLSVVDPSSADLVAGGAVTVGAPTLSTDKSFAVFPVTVAVSPAVVPVNSTITYSAAAGAVNKTGALSTIGQTIVATVSVGSSTSLTATLGDVDVADTGVVAIAAAPIAASVIASDSANFTSATGGVVASAKEKAKIDAVSGAGLKVTADADVTVASTTLVNFGAVVLKNVTGVKIATGAADYALATDVVANTNTFTVTGNFASFADATTGTVWLDTAEACTGGGASFATATSVDTTSAVFTATAVPVSGTPYFVCGETDAATLIQPVTPTIANFTLKDVASAGNFVVVPTGNSLYPLTYNGGLVDIWTYFPKTVADQHTFIRVINTGAVAAPVSVALLKEDGSIGTSHVLGGATVKPLGVATYSQADIEAVIGDVDGSTRPRLRFTAPTTINVQTLVVNANGSVSELSSAQ